MTSTRTSDDLRRDDPAIYLVTRLDLDQAFYEEPLAIYTTLDDALVFVDDIEADTDEGLTVYQWIPGLVSRDLYEGWNITADRVDVRYYDRDEYEERIQALAAKAGTRSWGGRRTYRDNPLRRASLATGWPYSTFGKN